MRFCESCTCQQESKITTNKQSPVLHVMKMSGPEPPMKKQKIDNTTINKTLPQTIDKCIETICESKKNLHAIVSDEIHQPLKLVKVFVGHIKNVKDISQTVLTLNEKIPLKEFTHLKRVRRQDIILCPVDHFLNETISIQDYIEKHVSELKDVFEYITEVDVPLHAPKLVQQYTEVNKIWSCNFHRNNYLEKLASDNFFSEQELSKHKMYMNVVFEMIKFNTSESESQYSIKDICQNTNATIVVDPSLDSIVAIAFDNRQDHPIQHSTMMAIDNVAKSQNGGAWSHDSSITGMDDKILQYLKEKFPLLKFGLQTTKIEVQSDNGVKTGPYLCTGYYIYMMKESCLMCSMALVHARARRVFFAINNELNGALRSKTKLQTVSSLNHHFEVFTGFL